MRLGDLDALKVTVANTLAKTIIYSLNEGVDVLKMIDATPAIDAVPVVRCKDCVCCSMHDDKLVCAIRREVINPFYYGRAEMVKPDDYCSRGVRKTAHPLDK